MFKLSPFLQPLLIIITCQLALPRSAYAYIDMSTGSMIVQMLLGGVAGLLVALKFYGRRLLSLMKFWKKRE